MERLFGQKVGFDVRRENNGFNVSRKLVEKVIGLFKGIFDLITDDFSKAIDFCLSL